MATTFENPGITGAKAVSWEHDNPRDLLLRLRREMPHADEATLARHIRDRVLDDEPQFLLPIIIYFVRNHMRSMEERQPPKRRARAAERHQDVKATKAVIVGKLLDLVMPGGQLLRDATKADCEAAGGFFAAVGTKLIKPNQCVSDVFDEKTLRALYLRGVAS